MILQDIQEFVLDKNILLVGNSDKLIEKDNSELIDSYDIVVRMNHAIPQKNIGTKTDIWLCSFISKIDQVNKFKIFNCQYNIRLNDDNNLDNSLKDYFYIWPNIERDKLREELGSETPSTGIMAIYFFLNYCDCDIDIIGFDGFKTGTFYNGNKKIAENFHNVMSERKYLSKVKETIRVIE